MDNLTKLSFENTIKERPNSFKKFVYGQTAYDTWHAYYYLFQCYEFDNKKIHQLNKRHLNLIFNKYLMLFVIIKSLKIKRFAELGSTLFETIKGLNFLSRQLKKKINFKKIKFTGIERSKIFNYLSKQINTGYKINHTDADTLDKVDLIYDRQVSPYVFRNEKKLINFYKKSRVIFSNLPVFRKKHLYKKKIHRIARAYGGDYCIFNIDELLIKNKKIFYLFGKKHPSSEQILFKKKIDVQRLDGFFLICNNNDFKKIIKELTKPFYRKFIRFNLNDICEITKLKNKHFYELKK